MHVCLGFLGVGATSECVERVFLCVRNTNECVKRLIFRLEIFWLEESRSSFERLHSRSELACVLLTKINSWVSIKLFHVFDVKALNESFVQRCQWTSLQLGQLQVNLCQSAYTLQRFTLFPERLIRVTVCVFSLRFWRDNRVTLKHHQSSLVLLQFHVQIELYLSPGFQQIHNVELLVILLDTSFVCFHIAIGSRILVPTPETATHLLHFSPK